MTLAAEQERLTDYLRWSDHHAAWTDIHVARHLGWSVDQARRVAASLVTAGRITEPEPDFVRLTDNELRTKGSLDDLPFALLG